MNDPVRYRIAPRGWSPEYPNPFTPDGSYRSGWSGFCILDRDDDQFTTGKSGRGPFSARFGRRVEHLEARLADFLRYENSNGRTVIFSFPEDMDAEPYIARALTKMPDPEAVRPEDPAIVVHSTTGEAWKKINAEGRLKAATELQRMERALDPSSEVGLYLRDEPPEYAEYIMFGTVESAVPEMIVASYQAGRFVLDEDAAYRPGVRLYLDNHRMIRAKRIVRDGLHVAKAHKQLPLSPYLLAAVGLYDVDPRRETGEWTPRSFTEKSNAFFQNSRKLSRAALDAG